MDAALPSATVIVGEVSVPEPVSAAFSLKVSV